VQQLLLLLPPQLLKPLLSQLLLQISPLPWDLQVVV
jgi:hypothetical protein